MYDEEGVDNDGLKLGLMKSRLEMVDGEDDEGDQLTSIYLFLQFWDQYAKFGSLLTNCAPSE